MFGAVLSDFVLTGAAALGLGALLAASEFWFTTVKWIDVAVMLGYAGFGAHAAKFLRSSAAAWRDRICGGVLLRSQGPWRFIAARRT
jgi:threonine/homoserine/homoserine lactone efflux protein